MCDEVAHLKNVVLMLSGSMSDLPTYIFAVSGNKNIRFSTELTGCIVASLTSIWTDYVRRFSEIVW